MTLAARKDENMATRVKKFTVNYNGDPIREGEVMVPFPYTELDAECCVNRECISSVTQGGRVFRVIYKAVPERWAKVARSALNLVENEELGHYDIPNSISMDKLFDEFNMEVGTSPSAEDILLGDDDQDLDDTLSTFAELVTSLIAKSPKIGYAVLLLHSKVKGEEFYKRIRLTRSPANRIRKQAEIILEGGLMSFDIGSLKCYKSSHDETYSKEALELLNHIIEETKKLQ